MVIERGVDNGIITITISFRRVPLLLEIEYLSASGSRRLDVHTWIIPIVCRNGRFINHVRAVRPEFGPAGARDADGLTTGRVSNPGPRHSTFERFEVEFRNGTNPPATRIMWRARVLRVSIKKKFNFTLPLFFISIFPPPAAAVRDEKSTLGKYSTLTVIYNVRWKIINAK